MSDAPKEKEEGKKKGGKLPIIIILAAVLGAGGFFGMKSRSSGGPPPEPEPELGSTMALGDEFIVNLHDREYFVRAKVTVQIDKNAHVGGGDGGGHGGGGGESPELTVMRDAVIARLNTVTISDIARPDFYPKFKFLLASDLNHALHIQHAAEEKKKEESKNSKKSKEKDKEKDHSEDKDKEKESEGHAYSAPKPGDLDHVNLADLENPDWDANEGPVLKIYFTDFATMRE